MLQSIIKEAAMFYRSESIISIAKVVCFWVLANFQSTLWRKKLSIKKVRMQMHILQQHERNKWRGHRWSYLRRVWGKFWGFLEWTAWRLLMLALWQQLCLAGFIVDKYGGFGLLSISCIFCGKLLNIKFDPESMLYSNRRSYWCGNSIGVWEELDDYY